MEIIKIVTKKKKQPHNFKNFCIQYFSFIIKLNNLLIYNENVYYTEISNFNILKYLKLLITKDLMK